MGAQQEALSSQARSTSRGGQRSGESVGPYVIHRLLGTGGMANVYVAEHVGLQKLVALKVLHAHIAQVEGAGDRIVREARAIARVQHPNVVDVSDVGADQGIPFLAMELLEGQSLRERFRSGVMSIEELGGLMLPVISAASTAHEHGIVHRDLKPENIFLAQTDDGEVRPVILDFGLVKDLVQPLSLTNTADFLGTPYYAAPEQARSAKDVDERADQYALGVILYEGLAGRAPFLGNSPIEVALKALNEEPPLLRKFRPDVPAGLEAVVMRAMAKDPDDRFDTLADLSRELTRALDDDVASCSRIGMADTIRVEDKDKSIPAFTCRSRADGIPKTRRGQRRRPWTFAGAFLLTSFLALAMIGFAGDRRSKDSSDSAGERAASMTAPRGQEVLRLAVIETAPQERLRKQYTPLMDHLERRIGVKLEIVVVSFASVTDLLLRGDIDLAWLRAHEYISIMDELAELELLARPVVDHRDGYQGLIISAYNGASSLDELRGATFCYVSKDSASGYRYPRILFNKRGYNPDGLFKEVYFVNSHWNVLKAVKRGDCDAGATYAKMFYQAERYGFRPEDFRILAQTSEIPFGPYVASPRMPAPLVSKLREELLKLESGSPLARELLGPLDFTGFVPVKRNDYDHL